ncbi:FKBP-type peptidyl-prolyl cis-trans isomerase [Saccharicrinis fermentans]|uniref:Peptidyl-prolyl cis-trans isomerase n=1 Tax=Saccharicrinis fermentans DSM 9555 = JCM 21142 TaxID=869213 RepID=W7YFS7_9BACT|nr:FKBP-type peptidyl-prolyl cis-trans isomerase [Saccharicrinis fermentans]GAF01454.1 FKBP-type 22 kDa peptidyl-prolyl cis-trans isomerase [Saccharicrinis fermentans DSM 9555 = JCM 21142]
MEKLSYSLGLSIAGNLQNSGVGELDYESFARGVKHQLEGTKPEVTPEEANQIINEFFTALQSKQFEANIKAGQDFLAENAKREGVVTLESGLQYEVVNEGSGAKPTAADNVKCHYHGTLLDGKVFDSSVQRGEPAVFPVNGVIAGWVEALQLMPLGSKWKLFVPSNLAYGEQGAGQDIPPHTTLIFEVELLEIV